MSDFSGLGDLVDQIKSGVAHIKQADDQFVHRLDGIEANINELYRKTGRPGPEGGGDVGFERKEAFEFCRQRHHALTVNKAEEINYSPSSSEVDLAINAQRGLKAYLRHGDLNRLPAEHRKGLSSFSFGPPGNFLLPPTQASRVLSCLVYPSNIASLVDRVTISGPSLVFMVDQVRFQMGAWSCDASCFTNNEQPDLSEGMGRVEVKPETVTFTCCAARDFIEDAAVDVQSWVTDKISVGMSALINEAILIGDGNGKPLGLLSPKSGIPVCETSSSTPPGSFTWQDLVALAMEVPVQWQQGAAFLLNQRTAAALLTMSDALGRPLLQSMQGVQDGPRWSLLGFPIYLVSQMPDISPGATPILFGNLRQTYTVVQRQNPTIELDPYSAMWCMLFKARARVGGSTTCSNASRLLRIR